MHTFQVLSHIIFSTCNIFFCNSHFFFIQLVLDDKQFYSPQCLSLRSVKNSFSSQSLTSLSTMLSSLPPEKTFDIGLLVSNCLTQWLTWLESDVDFPRLFRKNDDKWRFCPQIMANLSQLFIYFEKYGF